MSAETLVRKAAKAAVLPVGLVTSRGDNVVILLYHRVGVGDREIDLPARLFESQVAALADRSDVRTLDHAVSGRGRAGVVVTFDDGYADFHRVVLPILTRFRVPAHLYLATGLVANGGPRDPDALTWSQLEEAVSTGLVTVGSHTHGHTDLSSASESLAEDEMRRSKDLIEDRLGTSCPHFAYPWSVGSAQAESVARRVFRTAAVEWGSNRLGHIDPHRLGRVPVLRSDGLRFFRAKARGLLDQEALVYRALRRGPWRRR